jgi:hypothetical protein
MAEALESAMNAPAMVGCKTPSAPVHAARE